jgi:hypothetical protein
MPFPSFPKSWKLLSKWSNEIVGVGKGQELCMGEVRWARACFLYSIYSITKPQLVLY